MSSEVFTAVEIHFEVLCVVTPCSVAVGHQKLRRTLLYPSSACWYPTATLHDDRIQLVKHRDNFTFTREYTGHVVCSITSI
jgi:carboxypeptidase C (cathepsin A)